MNSINTKATQHQWPFNSMATDINLLKRMEQTNKTEPPAINVSHALTRRNHLHYTHTHTQIRWNHQVVILLERVNTIRVYLLKCTFDERRL